ncbi:MAG: hypothetical protein F6K19_11825 [Cyanothece sp. SIO1E1]|nr:hypothetical protein [Cyanothece sp. SIO1E1]
MQRPVAQAANDQIIVFPAKSTFVGHDEQVELVNQKIHTVLVGKHLEKGEMFSLQV